MGTQYRKAEYGDRHDKHKVIILRTTPFGESDLTLTAINQDGTKLSFFAKGARKSKKRFAGGVLEPTHYIEAVVRKSARGGLALLEEASLLEGFDGIRSSFDRLQLAFHFLQIMTRIGQEGDENSPELFDLLGNSLRALGTSEKLAVLALQFELKVLVGQGVLPPLAGVEKFMRAPVSQHHEIVASSDEIRSLRQQTGIVLHDYLGVQVRA